MPRKTELDYLAEIAAKAGTAEITGSVNVGTVDLGATSLAALEEVKVTNATDDSIINTSALASIVSTGAAVQTASFDAGANADYVVISIQGSGISGALYYDLSTNNSTWDAGNVASGFQTYYDIPAASTTDAYSYKSVIAQTFFGGTRSGYNGRLIVPLQQFQPSSGTITTYRYIRLNAPAAIAAWRYRFTSFKSVNPLLPSSVLGNPSTTRVAGRVDVGYISNLPALPAGTNTIGSVNIINADSISENSTLQLTVIEPNCGGSYVKQGSSFYQGPGDDILFWQSGNSRWEIRGDNNFLHTYNNSANQSAAYIPKTGWVIGDNPSFRGVEIYARRDIDLVKNVSGLGSGVEAAASGDETGTSVVAILKRGLVHLSSIISKLPALVSNRVPVDVSNLPVLPAGTNTIGTVNVLGGNATAVKVDGSAVTQPTRDTQPTDDYAINTSAIASLSPSGTALQSPSFDAGANADYVVISISGGGLSGALYYDLSTDNSTWDAGNLSSGFSTYYDLPATSTTDAYSYKNVFATSFFGATRPNYSARFIVPLQQAVPGTGTQKVYRYIRLNTPASNGGWRYRFTSYKSVDPLQAFSVPGNPSTTRVAGRVDVGYISNLPVLPAGTNTIGSVNVLGGNTTAVKVDIAPGTATENIVTGNSSATANTNAVVLAARANRKYLVIQNLSDTNMNLNFGTAASASTMLLPANGGGVSFEGTYVPSSSLNLVCSAASKPYYILEAYTS